MGHLQSEVQSDLKGWKHSSSGQEIGTKERRRGRVCCQQEVVSVNHFLSVSLVTNRHKSVWFASS